MIEGRCLCGAVTIRVGAHREGVSACHCTMCKRWTGGVYLMFTAAPEEVEISGPVKTYRSSPFAQRAFCETCGSHIWLRDDGGEYEFMPGLFEAAADYPLISEAYADQAMASVPLAGAHKRTTRAEYEASYPFVPEEKL